ncbi:unnamed protein product, partial [Porites evermanni]
AKLSFSGTLIEHVSELLKNDPSYDLSECVKINITGSLRLMGKEVKIEIFLGEYYKFALMARELSGATSTYARLWCLIHKVDRWNT